VIVLGHVRNGMIVSDDPVELPEGAAVRIELVANCQGDAESPSSRRQGGQYAGQIWLAPDFDEWPADLQESWGMIP